jgi:3-phenylpropionate/cinnamic acid dioxygenase small subunit
MTVEPSPALRQECEAFLYREAELLDDGKHREWLDLLTEDIGYRIPRRVTRERGAEGSDFSRDSYLYREDYGTLSTRVKRLEKEYAWAENPPSRTRRLVSNVRIQEAAKDRCKLRNNLLLFRNEKDRRDHDLIACEREDTLGRTAEGLKLADRTVYLDQAVFPSKNLSFFL